MGNRRYAAAHGYIFPLFAILEDFGILPRFAFNLDYPFEKCNACGKQALTTCMGLGCNAVGVTGARIIDSPRERAIAVITNSSPLATEDFLF